jgi:hypothetical protein
MKVFLPLVILAALPLQERPAPTPPARAVEEQGPQPAARIPGRVAPAAAQDKQAEEIKKILNDPTLWGKDFQQLLKFLPLLAGSGEKTVLVFPRAVVGGTPFPNLPRSTRAIERASAANKIVNDTKLGEEFKRSVGARNDQLLTLFHANPFPEDDSQRVTLERAGAEYLLPDNSIAAIRKSQGEPQKVTSVRINSENEDRPEMLIYYEYAGGAVTFVMHNYKRYGYVNRVILDIPAIQSALASKPNR